MPEVILTQGMIAVVDSEDAPSVLLHSWRLHRSRNKLYARAEINGVDIYLHRFILDAPVGIEVDHIDGDGLNCKRLNLRRATPSKNGANRGPNKNNASGYKGVSFDRWGNRWRAAIKVNRKTIRLGTFPDAESAARAYDEAAKRHFGEFAGTNFR